MWNTVSIVFCVLLVVVSFLFLQFSIACLILIITSGVVLVHELQWNVNLSQLKIWLKSSLESLMDNKSSKSKPFPRVLNRNGVSRTHSPLMTNKFKASPNLTPQSKFVSEPIVSDIFKMSLNDSNKHSTPISMSGSRNYKSDRLEDERNSWSNIKSKKHQSITIQKNVQSVAGPLLVSTRFNSNISSELSANASSAGFSSRLAQKGAEMASTHQPKYAGIGVFPVVQLQSRSPKHHISSPARSVRVRIAPPDNSPLCGNMDPNDFSNVNGGEDSVKSVLQVLKEISRKRIHSQVDEDGDETVKRPKKDRIEENLTKSLDPAVQNKRGREDSPRSSGEEVKRQRRHLNGGKAAAAAATAKSSNEIMSSLSSSLAVKPPHLCKQQQSKATKRKAHAVDWSRCSTPVSGNKVLKVNTSPNQDQDQATKPSKYQDDRPTTNPEEVHEGSGQACWIGGMVRIEAGERRLLARSAGSGALISVEGGGGAEMTSRSPSPPAQTAPHTATPPHPPPQSTRLLKQMADPGQRLKDMLAAINGDDDVSTEEATMSPNVVAILKSAKSTSSTCPSTSILKTSVHSDAQKTVSFAQPLTSFSESSQPSTSLSTATVVSTSLNNSIQSAEAMTTVKNVSPFTLPSSASPTATGFQTATAPSTNAPTASSISSAAAFTLPKSDDKSQTNTPVFSDKSTYSNGKTAPQLENIPFGITKESSSLNSTLFGAKSAAAEASNGTVEKSSISLVNPVSSSASNQPSFSFGSNTNEYGAKTVDTSATSLFGTKPAESSSTSLLRAKPVEPSTTLFGAKPAESLTTTLFGAKPAESLAASPFGAKPAESSTASPFTAKPAESSTASPFGAKPAESPAVSLFGAKPAESSTASLFTAKPAEATTTSSSANIVFGVGNAATMFNTQAKSSEATPSSGAGVAASKGVTSPPAFGNSSLFGGSNTTTNSANNMFASKNAATSSAATVFGGSNNATATPLFGGFSNTPTGSGLQVFGAASASTAGSSAPTTTASSPAVNLFGAKTNSESTKGGVTTTTTVSASGSLFTGANTAFGGSSSSSPSIFGAATSSGSSFGTGFGGTASKESGFGTAPTTASTFGSSATSAIFGGSSDAPKTNAFSSGTSAAPMFGATPVSGTSFGGAGTSGSTFGQTESAGGGFGATSTSTPPAFGGFSSSGAFGNKSNAPATTTSQPSAFSQASSSLFSFGSQSPATTTQSTSIFNGVAQTTSTALTNGGFGGGGGFASEDKAKSTAGFGSAFHQPAASSSAAPAFSFGTASSGGSASGGTFAFGAATNNNAGAAQPTENAISAFTFPNAPVEQTSKPFAFGGVSSSGPTTANQPSAFAFNSNSASSAATPSAGFQFSAGTSATTPAQPQVPGAFVFGGASTSNSGFGMNPPAFTLGAGGGLGGGGGAGAAAGARFSIGSGSTSVRSRSVARAKRTK